MCSATSCLSPKPTSPWKVSPWNQSPCRVGCGMIPCLEIKLKSFNLAKLNCKCYIWTISLDSKPISPLLHFRATCAIGFKLKTRVHLFGGWICLSGTYRYFHLKIHCGNFFSVFQVRIFHFLTFPRGHANTLYPRGHTNLLLFTWTHEYTRFLRGHVDNANTLCIYVDTWTLFSPRGHANTLCIYVDTRIQCV